MGRNIGHVRMLFPDAGNKCVMRKERFYFDELFSTLLAKIKAAAKRRRRKRKPHSQNEAEKNNR